MKHTNIFLTKTGLLLLVSTIFISCQKEISKPAPLAEEFPTAANQSQGHLQQTKTFSAAVAQKWQDLQNRFLRTPTNANPFGRHGHRWFAYCGIALYESVVQGMPRTMGSDLSMPDPPARRGGVTRDRDRRP